MCLENVHVLYGILDLSLSISHPYSLHSVNNHRSEEVRLGSEELGAHGSLGGLQDGFVCQVILAHNQRPLDEVDGLFERHTVTSHDRGWVNLVFDQVIGSLQKFGGEDHNRGSSVTYLTVLDLGKLDEDFCGGMCHLKLFENSGAIVSDRHITDVIDEHLIEALRTE